MIAGKRAYEGSDDASRVFRKMLETGYPPDDWDQMLAGARAVEERLKRFAGGVGVCGRQRCGNV